MGATSDTSLSQVDRLHKWAVPAPAVLWIHLGTVFISPFITIRYYKGNGAGWDSTVINSCDGAVELNFVASVHTAVAPAPTPAPTPDTSLSPCDKLHKCAVPAPAVLS